MSAKMSGTEDGPLAIRAKMIGVLLKDARLAAGKTVKECADVLECSVAAYNAHEQGRKVLSLPQLELLANFLSVPLAHFWDTHLLVSGRSGALPASVAEVTRLRDRIIGAILRQARQQAGYTLKALADELGLPPGRLSAYEFGQKSAPLPELEMIAARLGLSIEELFETQGTVGERHNLHRAVEAFNRLPPDLREFILQPANEHYLRLAQQLSQMPAERLRAIAESLLDITY